MRIFFFFLHALHNAAGHRRWLLMQDMWGGKVMFAQHVELVEHSHRVKVIHLKKVFSGKCVLFLIAHVKIIFFIFLFYQVYRDSNMNETQSVALIQKLRGHQHVDNS